MTIREYLKTVLNGVKDYIMVEDEALNGEITESYNEAINNTSAQLTTLINSLDTDIDKNIAEISDLKGSVTNINTTLSWQQSEINAIKASLEKKVDSEIVIPWANYNATNQTVEIGISNSPYYIKSTATALEIYQGTTKITYWEGGHLKATNITATTAISSPEVIINGLVLKGNSTDGWSFM